MPIRSFYCKQCDQSFEKLYLSRDQFEKEKDFTQCPECSIIAEPELSITGKPVFYGSGFHETEYRNKK